MALRELPDWDDKANGSRHNTSACDDCHKNASPVLGANPGNPIPSTQPERGRPEMGTGGRATITGAEEWPGMALHRYLRPSTLRAEDMWGRLTLADDGAARRELQVRGE